jgi:hypothetical protein
VQEGQIYVGNESETVQIELTALKPA